MLNVHTNAYIGIGSNLDNPLSQVQRGLAGMRALKQVRHLVCSPFYTSKAIGPGNQPDYINAVARIETHLPPFNLLKALQAIEKRQGRKRHTRWGARTLDLDLLLYGETCMDSELLHITPSLYLQPQFCLVSPLRHCQ